MRGSNLIEYWIDPKHNAEYGVPLMDAPCGKMTGVRSLSREGRDIYSYKGIPYAQPPTGELRFKRPQPLLDGWKGTLKATKFGNKCYQGWVSRFHHTRQVALVLAHTIIELDPKILC